MYNAATNNLSPLPFYKNFDATKVEWESRRWYAYGKVTPLLCNPAISPFFFSFDAREVIVGAKVYKMTDSRGMTVSTGDFSEVAVPEGYTDWKAALTDNGFRITQNEKGISNAIYDGAVQGFLEEGMYYIEFKSGRTDIPEFTAYYTSEIFRVVSPSEKYLTIRWSNDAELMNGLGAVPAGFKNSIMLEASIARPEYAYEEEGEERMGFFYPTKQVSYKKYKFSFLAPEYLCDVVRMIPMCDHLTIEGGEEYKPTKIDFDFDWTEVSTIASVDCEFTTNTIVKRVASSYVKENLGSFNDSFNNSFDK